MIPDQILPRDDTMDTILQIHHDQVAQPERTEHAEQARRRRCLCYGVRRRIHEVLHVDCKIHECAV